MNQYTCRYCSQACDAGDVCEQCKSQKTLAPESSVGKDELTLPPEKTTVNDDRKAGPSRSLNRLGEYELVEELARGGMGVVYKARHQKLNRDVALKMILGGKFSSEGEVQRFYIEAEAAAKLDHPGIVPIYEIGTEDGQPFFAMKLIEGGSLAQRIGIFRDDARKAVELVRKIALAIHHAHQRGILHRDIKPANILLDENEDPVVTDLGLAKSTANESNLTQTGVIIGTPSYMPPEQAQSTQTLTTAADIYSIGAILYELLTGQPPHQGSSAFETVMKVINDPVSPVREKSPGTNRDLELICMKCLEKNPDGRYSSAADLAEDLEHWLDGKPVSVRPISVFAKTAHWLNQNRKVLYAILLLLIGVTLTVPLAVSILGSLDVGEVATLYVGDESDPVPLLYSFSNIPSWLSFVSGISILLISPMIGMLITMFSRPKSIKDSLLHGSVVAVATSILLYLLLGGLLHSVASQGSINNSVRALASSAWPEADPDADADAETIRKELLNDFPKLNSVADNSKVNHIASRIFADGVAGSLMAMVVMGVVLLLWSCQIVFGTLIAFVLTKRHRRWWIRWPRYAAAWLAAFATVSVLAASIGNGNFNGSPFSQLPLGNKIMTLAMPPLFLFLIMFRWSRLWSSRKSELQ